MANMKRESRAYSFEDQKWEMEIRQELLQRKVDSDETSKNDVQELLKKTKLTQKQKVWYFWFPTFLSFFKLLTPPSLPLTSPPNSAHSSKP